MVFMGQLYLSTPTFSLVLATLVFRATQRFEAATGEGRKDQHRLDESMQPV
jgi:hypothetical protein